MAFWAHCFEYRVISRVKRVLAHNRDVILDLPLYKVSLIDWQALVMVGLTGKSVIESDNRVSTSLPTSIYHGVIEVFSLVLIYWSLFWYLVLYLDLLIVTEPAIDSIYFVLFVGLIQEGLSNHVAHVKDKDDQGRKD